MLLSVSMQITDVISIIRKRCLEGDLAWYIFWPFSASAILNNAGNHISLWLSPYAADFRSLLGYNNVFLTQ